MPTSYTSVLRLAQPASGELSGTWGDVINNNITAMIEQAITGLATVAMADSNQTLTTANGSTDQSRCMMVECTGALTGSKNVVCPTATKLYVVKNSTTGGFGIVFKTTGGTGITVAASTTRIIYCDGTNVVDALPVAAAATTATTATTLATPRAIYGNTFDGSAALAQVIASTYGGTGNGWAKFTGPTTSEKTFTLPDSSSTIVVQGGALGTPSSGTLTSCTGLPPAGVTGTAAVLGANTFTGAQVLSDQQVSRAMLIDAGYTVYDKGNVSNATFDIAYTAGSIQTYTATGSTVTITTSAWPPTGNLGEVLLIATNAGAYTHSWPAWNWIKPDGTTTTSIATYLAANTGRTALQSSGVDQILVWTRDAGTTIYAKLV